MKNRITPADIAVAAGLLALALMMILLPPLFADEPAYVVISVWGEEPIRYPIGVNREVSLISGGVSLTVTIEGGEVSVTHTDCPDQLCRLTGRIGRRGQSILCAPAGVAITIEGGESDADFIAG